MIVRGLFHISKTVIRLLWLALILAILIGGTFFWFSSQINNERERISDWLTDVSGYPVEIGALDIHWQGWKPKARAQRLTIQLTPSTPISCEQAQLGLDLYESIMQRQLVFSEVRLDDMQLAVVRQLDGDLTLAGKAWSPQSWSAQAYGTGDTALPAWLTQLQRLEVHNIQLDYADLLMPNLSGMYTLKQASIAQQGMGWAWQSDVILPPALGDAMGFSGTVDTTQHPAAVTWQFTGKALSEQWLDDLPIAGAIVRTGKLDIQVAGTAAAMDVQTIQGDISLQNMQLQGEGKAVDNRFILPSLVLTIEGLRQGEGGNVTIKYARDAEVDPAERGQWSVNYSPQGWQLNADQVALLLWSKLALVFDGLPDAAHAQLKAQYPQGTAENVYINYSIKDGLQQAVFGVAGLKVNAWQDIPAVAVGKATINIQQRAASVTLIDAPVTLNQGHDMINMSHVTGQLQWQKTSNGWLAETSKITLSTADFSLTASGSMQQQDDVLRTDINAEVQDFQVPNWKRYVAMDKLDPEFHEWAKDAFTAGVISKGTLRWQGNVADFPYEKEGAEGSFSVLLAVEDAGLHYAPDWPDLSGVTGEVIIANNTLTVNSNSGEIAGMAMGETQTVITNLTNRKALLTLSGKVAGGTPNVITFLATSPLKEKFGSYVAGVESAGNTAIDLMLKVPLSHSWDAQVTGKARLRNSRLKRADLADVAITNINGTLAFTNDGLTVNDATAHLFDTPVSVDVSTGSEAGVVTTTISAHSHLGAAQLAEVLKQPLPDFVTGAADYQVNVKISEQAKDNFDIDVTLTSDLVGIGIDLPAPLGKPKETARSLAADVSWATGLRIQGRYDNILSAAAAQQDDAWRGEIRLGDQSPALPLADWRIRGTLSTLDVAPWQDWLVAHPTDDEADMPFNDISVRFGTLSLPSLDLHHITMTALKSEGAWQVVVAADELAGSVTLPMVKDETTPIKGTFKYIHLPKSTDEEVLSSIQDKAGDKTSTLWPPVVLYCDDFRMNDLPLGQIKLYSHRTNNAWVLSELTLTGPTHYVAVSGEWQQTADINETHLIASGESDDAAALLTHFGFQPAVVSKNVDLELNLKWAGDPLAFTPATIKGKLGLTVGAGQLVDVDPGAAGRVFSLLSFTAIPRRLALDFSDLFNEGFAFDSIESQFTIAAGYMVSDKTLLTGPTANVAMTGRVGLVTEDYDQQIVIKPNLSSSLPLVGAAAGGVVGLGIGTAVLLADKVINKLFGGDLINIMSYQYHLSGQWDAPEFSPLVQTPPASNDTILGLQ